MKSNTSVEIKPFAYVGISVLLFLRQFSAEHCDPLYQVHALTPTEPELPRASCLYETDVF
jgi:hypothetical protein